MEDENRRLKKMVADLSLDGEALKTVIRKKRVELVSARRDVALLMTEHRLSERHACRLLELDRSSYRYEPMPDTNHQLREALVALARQKPRYGYRRLWAVLSRRGWEVIVKRIYRLYRGEGLIVRRLQRKRVTRERSGDTLLTGLSTSCRTRWRAGVGCEG